MLEIKKCTPKDYAKLAALKKQLIEEERETDPPSASELEANIDKYMRGGYQAVYFVEKNSIIGYALIKMNVYPYRLSEFYIGKKFRKRDYGRLSFSRLLDYLCTNTISIDAASRSRMKIGFWKSLGFNPGGVASENRENRP